MVVDIQSLINEYNTRVDSIDLSSLRNVFHEFVIKTDKINIQLIVTRTHDNYKHNIISCMCADIKTYPILVDRFEKKNKPCHRALAIAYENGWNYFVFYLSQLKVFLKDLKIKSFIFERPRISFHYRSSL